MKKSTILIFILSVFSIGCDEETPKVKKIIKDSDVVLTQDNMIEVNDTLYYDIIYDKYEKGYPWDRKSVKVFKDSLIIVSKVYDYGYHYELDSLTANFSIKNQGVKNVTMYSGRNSPRVYFDGISDTTILKPNQKINFKSIFLPGGSLTNRGFRLLFSENSKTSQISVGISPKWVRDPEKQQKREEFANNFNNKSNKINVPNKCKKFEKSFKMGVAFSKVVGMNCSQILYDNNVNWNLTKNEKQCFCIGFNN